ncbi:MAG: hypothetical protein KC432_11560, partial [Thermomicrobiales bacterium]|nr:hypothetical protein [Thermomicrobiales bacterium]
MATTQYRLSGEDVDAVVLSGIEGYWALHDGVLAEKPGMAWDHQNVALELGHHLRLQLLKKSRPRLTR